MINKIQVKGKTLYYDLQYKDVKNINLRIKADGTIHVSASKRVPQRVVDEFLMSKADFIMNVSKGKTQITFFPAKT